MAMYLQFYGLREEPFGVTPDPQFLYLSPGHREAQAILDSDIRAGRGFTAVVAPPGMGKTSLLFDMLRGHARTTRSAFLFQTQCNPREFMRYLIAEFGFGIQKDDFVELNGLFQRMVLEEAQHGKHVILVVDEAQNLRPDVLEAIRLLSDFETPDSKLLHIVLSGQPELAEKLADPDLTQLRQRIAHLIRLEPLSEEEVQDYIRHRLEVAGYFGDPIFSARACRTIFQRSQGIPRIINNLCFNALSLGHALGNRLIDAAILAQVCSEMDFVVASRGLTDKDPRLVPETVEERAPASLPKFDVVSEIRPPLVSLENKQEDEASLPYPKAAGIPGDFFPPSISTPLQVVPPVMTRNLPDEVQATVPRVADSGQYDSNEDDIQQRPTTVDVNALVNEFALLGMHAEDRRIVRKRKPPAAESSVVREPTPEPVIKPPPVENAPVLGPQIPIAPAPAAAQRPALVPVLLAWATDPVNRKYVLTAAFAFVLLVVWQISRWAEARPEAGHNTVLASPEGLALEPAPRIAGSVPDSQEPIKTTTTEPGPAISVGTPQIVSGEAEAAPPNHALSDQANVTAISQSVVDVIEEIGGAENGPPDFRFPRNLAGGVRSSGSERPVRTVEPVYPGAARLQQLEGSVELSAVIGEDGSLRHIRALNGNPLLAQAAMEAIKKWRYQPHRRADQASNVQITVNFKFARIDSSARN